MSVGLPTHFATHFPSEVKHFYQQAENPLAGTVDLRTLSGEESSRFVLYNKLIAQPKAHHAQLTPDNIGSNFVTGSVTDFIVKDLVDKQHMAKVKHDERRTIAESIGFALRRRSLQIIINASKASATTLTVSADIGNSNTNANVAKLREAQRLADKNNWPMSDRYALFHANQKASLLSQTQLQSSDFGPGTSTQTGQLPPVVHGFRLLFIGDMDEGGLPLMDDSFNESSSGDNRFWFAWHKRGIGVVRNDVDMGSTEWSSDRDAWWVKGHLSEGAIAVEDSSESEFGIIHGLADDDAAAA